MLLSQEQRSENEILAVDAYLSRYSSCFMTQRKNFIQIGVLFAYIPNLLVTANLNTNWNLVVEGISYGTLLHLR
jgi:hypothetical protein